MKFFGGVFNDANRPARSSSQTDFKYKVAVPQSLTLSLQIALGAFSNPAGSLENKPSVRLVVPSAGLSGLKVEIFALEHAPPHFHVKVGHSSASYQITDCKPLNEDPSLKRRYKDIHRWWRANVDALVDTWNRLRPTDCPVGAVGVDEIVK